MVGFMSMFKSMSNLVTAIVLFACLVLGAALLMAGGEPGKTPTAQPPVIPKHPEAQTEAASADAGTAGTLAQEMRTATSKPASTAEKTAHSSAPKGEGEPPGEPLGKSEIPAGERLGGSLALPAALKNAARNEVRERLQQSEQTQAVRSENNSDDIPRSYKVQQGDSLSGIAHKLLGAANRWPEIARANNITEHDWILPGQELIIPANAERIGSADERPLAPRLRRAGR